MSFPNIPGYRVRQIPTMGPEQRSLYDQLYGSVRPALAPGLSQLARMAQGDPSMFQQMEAPAMRQFSEQLMPRLAEQQTGRGGGLSSGYLNRMQEASSRFSQDLQSQRLGMQQQALSQLLGLGQNLMNTQTQQPFLQQRTGSRLLEALGRIAGSGPQVVSALARAYASGGMG